MFDRYTPGSSIETEDPRQETASLEHAKLLVQRELAKQDYYWFCRYQFLKRKRFKWLQNWHHQKIADAMQRVFNGESKNLIINMPPRYSKTEMCVVDFIAWCLGQVPDAEFIHTSYSQRIASHNSWDAREIVQQQWYRDLFPAFPGLRTDSTARDDWRTVAGGCVYAVGAEGTITGYGAGKEREGFGGAILIDDPHKAGEASSDVIRRGVIDWYQNTLQSRVNSKHTPKILVMQRLHEEDLAGWLLNGGDGEHWDHLVLSAVQQDAEGNDVALWPHKHSMEQLRIMETAAPYVFAGQYRQAPSPPAGGTIKPDNIEIVDALPVDIEWLRGWDFGATENAGDPTASLKLGKRKSTGRFYIADVFAEQLGPEGVESALKNTASMDGKSVRISIPQDPGAAGKVVCFNYVKMLAGHDVRSSPESGDKVARATPMAAQINVGNFSMLRADWNQKFINQCRFFPNGTHDDMVDAGSRAFNELNGSASNAIDYLRQLVAQQQAKEIDR